MKLDHSIVRSHDKRIAAAFMAEVRGFPHPERFQDPAGHDFEILTRPYASGD